MEDKNFYEIGKERSKLRRDVLGEVGVSAHELSARGAVTETEFSDAVAKGNIADVAERAVVAAETDMSSVEEKLGRISELTDEAKEFHFADRAQRSAYAEARGKDARSAGELSGNDTESEIDVMKRDIFRELDLLDEFRAKQKQGEYLATRHQGDPRLADRLRRNARIEEMLGTRRAALEADPDTRLVVREHELDRYNRELDRDHYVLTRSRKEYVARVETLVNQGKPILLEGHTGTGKSELARIAARELTGADPEVVYCNPQTRVSDIFGKQSLKETETGATVTGTDYGPLVRAMTEGKLCLFDEFNELDPRGRQMLKYLYNAKPGDMIDVPGDGKVRIREGFGLVMTANLKSGKYQAKGELEPQEARVFQDSTIRVDYPPKDELYDVALSALSDTEGRVMLSRAEAETTLKHFTDAIADIGEAYAKAIPGHYGQDGDFAMKGRKKRPALEKYVLDTGMVVRLLQGFHVARMKYGTPLRAFIDASLARTFEGDRVGEDDKKLAIFIFAKHGFLKGEGLSEGLDLDYADGRLDPKIFPEIPEAELSSEASLKTLSTEDVARFDPYGKRKISVADAFDEFDVKPPVMEPGAEGEASFAEARELFRQDFLGPEEIEATFGFTIDRKDIPEIPFSRKELQEANDRSEMLVLNWDRTPEGEPLTTGTMVLLALVRLPNGNVIEKNQDGTPKRCLLYEDQFGHDGSIKSDAWFSGDKNILSVTPERGWQLVSPDIIPDSTGKNYLDQTQLLSDSMRKTFPNGVFPQGSKERKAEEEWEQERPKIQRLLDAGQWQDASVALSRLEISKLFREPVGNTIFRYLVAYRNGKQLFMDRKYSWSDTVDSVGGLARFGTAGASGARVCGLRPGYPLGDLGVVSSRR